MTFRLVRTKAFAFFAGFTILVLALDLPIRMLDARLGLALPSELEWMGWLCLLAGVLLIVAAEWVFIAVGGGTGAPGNPPGRLVSQGIYRRVRNPIYIGAFLELLGVALDRSSATYLAISVIFLALIHLFVVYVEEPRTELRFGGSYRQYRATVPRWVPRRPE